MFRATCRLLSHGSPGVGLQHFKRILVQSWGGQGAPPPGRVGIAVSGGVDSMALATLCAAVRKETDTRWPDFTAFVVDHKLRENSTDEAHKVLANLAKLGIDRKLLTLDWTGLETADGIPHVEAAARRLRYQALGKACNETGARHLLVGHHADDQAETVLVRIVNKSLGAGLAGMRSTAPIPECEGIYGVACSESSRQLHLGNLAPGAEPKSQHSPPASMPVVGAGIHVVRPLLSYTKQQLINTCKIAGTTWFEDQTNADQTLALRNTVRSLLAIDALPIALRRPRLLALASGVRVRQEALLAQVRRLGSNAKVQLDLRSGSARCNLSLQNIDQIGDRFLDVLILFLREVLRMITPLQKVDRAAVHNAVFALLSFTPASARTFCKVSVAGVTITASERSTSTASLLMHRQSPTKASMEGPARVLNIPTADAASAVPIAWSTWLLWDNRYWIRAGRTGPGCETVSIQFLTVPDLAVLRDGLDKGQRVRLAKEMALPNGNVRFTIPAMALQQREAADQIIRPDRVIALPSIGWSSNDCQRWSSTEQSVEGVEWYYDIRYRQLDTSLTKAVEAVDGVKWYDDIRHRQLDTSLTKAEEETEG